MKTRRTPLVLATAVVSLGLLAACSDEADQPADAPVEQVTPAPGTAPMDSVPPADTAPSTPPVVPDVSPTPGTDGVTPDTNSTTPPPIGADPAANDPLNPAPEAAPSSSAAPGFTEKLAASGQALQESAVDAASTVGEKAGELRDATGERMSQMGQAIRDGAARADEAIQESLNQRGEPTSNTQQPAGI